MKVNGFDNFKWAAYGNGMPLVQHYYHYYCIELFAHLLDNYHLYDVNIVIWYAYCVDYCWSVGIVEVILIFPLITSLCVSNRSWNSVLFRYYTAYYYNHSTYSEHTHSPKRPSLWFVCSSCFGLLELSLNVSLNFLLLLLRLSLSLLLLYYNRPRHRQFLSF